MDLLIDVRLKLRFARKLDLSGSLNICLGRVTRRLTNRPLALDEYLYSSLFASGPCWYISPLAAQSHQVLGGLAPDSSIPQSPYRSNSLSPTPAPAVSIKNFSYLQRPEIYHSLPPSVCFPQLSCLEMPLNIDRIRISVPLSVLPPPNIRLRSLSPFTSHRQTFALQP